MRDKVTILEANSQQDFVNMAMMAKTIWEEHYSPLIGIDQTAYMIEKYQTPSAIRDQVENQGYLYYYIKLNDNEVGYIAIQPQENSLFLSKYYIQKESRNRGLGRVAFDFCVDYARRHDKVKVWLTVNRKNGDAIEKYLHMGFQIVKEQDTKIGSGYEMNDYVLEKNV